MPENAAPSACLIGTHAIGIGHGFGPLVDIIESGLFRWGAPPRTLQVMRESLEQVKLVSPGWEGDSAEEEWALYVDSIVRKN